MTRACIPEWELGGIILPLGHASPFNYITRYIFRSPCSLPAPHPPYSSPPTSPSPPFFLRNLVTSPQNSLSVQMSSHVRRFPPTYPEVMIWAAFCVFPHVQKGSSARPILNSQGGGLTSVMFSFLYGVVEVVKK